MTNLLNFKANTIYKKKPTIHNYWVLGPCTFTEVSVKTACHAEQSSHICKWAKISLVMEHFALHFVQKSPRIRIADP